MGGLVSLIWGLALAASTQEKLAVLPLTPNRLQTSMTQALDQLVVGALDDLHRHNVITAADISALLGLERMKDALGCTDVVCAAEIGGALGADILLSGTASLLGDEVVLSLSVIEPRTTRVRARKQVSFVNDEKRFSSAVRQAVFAVFGAEAPSEKQRETEWLKEQRSNAIVAQKAYENAMFERSIMTWTAIGLLAGSLTIGGTGVLAFALAPSEGAIRTEYQHYLKAPTEAEARGAYSDVERLIARRNTLSGVAIGMGVFAGLLGSAALIVWLATPAEPQRPVVLQPRSKPREPHWALNWALAPLDGGAMCSFAGSF